MGSYVCPYCLQPCGMMGDGCVDKGLPVKPADEIKAAADKAALDYCSGYGYGE